MSYTGDKDIYVTVDGLVETDYDAALEANHEYTADHSGYYVDITTQGE
jgi:hypothetical protein